MAFQGVPLVSCINSCRPNVANILRMIWGTFRRHYQLQNKSLEILLDQYVLYIFHGGLQEVGIGGVCEMYIDFSVSVFVDGPEAVGKELLGRFLVSILPSVVGEVRGER